MTSFYVGNLPFSQPDSRLMSAASSDVSFGGNVNKNEKNIEDEYLSIIKNARKFDPHPIQLLVKPITKANRQKIDPLLDKFLKAEKGSKEYLNNVLEASQLVGRKALNNLDIVNQQ